LTQAFDDSSSWLASSCATSVCTESTSIDEMKSLIAIVSLSLVGVALGDPLACDGQACMVENDQAALLQSSILNKGEESGLFCQQAKDYLCYQKTGLPACCSDGRRNTCGTVKPPCDNKGKGTGKGKSSTRRRGTSSPGSWGPKTDNTYCSDSYLGKDSRKAAKSACKRDEACGGIYQPGNTPEKWFLCKGFNTLPSTSNSVVIKKLGGSSPTEVTVQTPPEVTVQTITAGRSSTYKVELSKLGNPTLWDMKHYLKYDLKAYISDNYSWLDWQHKPLFPDIWDLQSGEKNKDVHAGEWYFVANK